MVPVKVLILITKANWGGAQRYVFDLATHLPKDTYKVEVMAGSGGPLIDRLWEAGIPAHGDLALGRDVSFWGDVKAFFQLVKFIRQKKPDVLHLNSSKIGGLGALAGRFAGVKNIVFTAHGWAFNEKRPVIQKLVIRATYWVTLKLCHRVIAVSKATADQVRNWPFIGDKFCVVHNGIDQGASFSKQNARHELVGMDPALKKAIEESEEKNTVWIGSMAELHSIKGYEYALNAVHSSLKELRRINPRRKIIYIICGEGESRTKIEVLIEMLGLGESVFLLGHIPDAAQYLKAFDIFLMASLSEGLPYAVLEAGMAQTAVVATTVGGIPEIVDDMTSGILVQPKNDRELGHAILFAIEHPDDRRKYAAALKEKIGKDFSIQKMIEATEKTYRGER